MTLTLTPVGTIETVPEQQDDHVVRRQVHISWPSLAEQLRAAGLAGPCEVLLPGARSLHLTDGFRWSASAPPSWSATGYLQWDRVGLRRRVRVPIEVWIEPWSDETSHLQLLPHALLVHRWGIHRQRRYFALAHAAADQLLLLLH